MSEGMVQGTEVEQRFRHLPEQLGAEEYNFTHFRSEHLRSDMQRMFAQAGIHPGQMAPDFELPQVNGGTLRLSRLRGMPVLLHFGSYT